MVDFGNALLQIGAATNGANSLADYQLNQLKTQAAQNELNTQNNALAALALARKNGITDPQSILNSLAAVDPQYAEKAATLQAQNPLASLIGNNGGNAGSPTQNAPIQSATGDALLQKLPQSIAAQVKALAEGRMQFPAGFALKSPYWQQMLQLVSQYDPTFDAVNYNSRANTRKDFTSGKSAQNITALNTAMGHLSSLSDAYDALGNTPIPMFNTVKNAIGNELNLGDIQTNTSNVETDAHAVSEELAKVFRSTGMAESDVKAWEKKLTTSASPQQSKAVINQAIELMNSRLDALGQQYNQGMGTSKQGIELLSPKAQQAYQKLTGAPPAETAASGNLTADNAKQKASAIPDGTTATNPATGERIIRKSGKWQPLK